MHPFRAAIHVRPGSRADGVGGQARTARPDDPPALMVRVRARPVEGAATTAAERAVAYALAIRPRQVRVVRGAQSRDKVVEITDPPEDIARRWADLLQRPG